MGFLRPTFMNQIMRTQIHTNLLLFAATVLAATFLVGCSGPPSESAGKQIVQKQIQEQSKGLIQLVSFRKTNATGGDAAYSMEYEVEIEFLDTVRVFQDPNMNGPFYAEKGTMSASTFMMQQRQKGERVKQSGTITFSKTEKGWRGPDGNIY